MAIFGGTFNPVHWGHLCVAEMARDQFLLEQVLWVPAAHPPHKGLAPVAFEHRLEMVRRAIADQPAFVVTDIDQQQTGKSYAIGTLENLQLLYPQTRWYWILGADTLPSLPRWYRVEELAHHCTWLIAPRPHPPEKSSISLPAHIPWRWEKLEMPGIEVSSSLVRNRLRQGRSIRYLVPEAVRLYIEMQELYTK